MEPQRIIDGELGLLPKVFIVYPHNPEVYVWDPDPEKRAEISKRKEEAIRRQDKLVYDFAQYLQHLKIAVAYEGLLRDEFTLNHMKWFQKQIADSDYVILIITNSFCHFLSNQPPEGTEMIFTGQFLHNFVNNPSKPILPVFLGRRRVELLPDALRSSKTYEIIPGDPPCFDVNQPQFDSLYALLTRRNRIKPPPTVDRIPVIGGLSRRRQGKWIIFIQRSQYFGISYTFAAAPAMNEFSEVHRRMYESLRRIQRPLSAQEKSMLSEKPGFASHWRSLANYFRFTPAEIERVVTDSDQDDTERCFTFLSKWITKEGANATVSGLTQGIYSIRNTTMLEIASSVIHQQ